MTYLLGDELPTVYALLERLSSSQGSAVFAEQGVVVPYKELPEVAFGVADALVRRGTGPGDVVGVLAPTAPELLTGFFGVLAAGGAASILPIPTLGTDLPLRLEPLVRSARMRRLVVAEAFGECAQVLAERTGVQVLRVEECAPSYFHRLCERLGDCGPWGEWVHRWTAEEGRHAIVMRAYLHVTRAVDPSALEQARMDHLTTGYQFDNDSVLDTIVYTTLQEWSTRVGRRNAGVASRAPDHITIVDSPDDVRNIEIPNPDKVAWLSQTTLSVDETMQTVDALREEFPQLTSPPSDGICHAPQNRQTAVKRIAAVADLLIVVGSGNSSNSVRLVEIALAVGAANAHLIDHAEQLETSWLEGVGTVGVTSGASVPEILVDGALRRLASYGYADVETVTVAEEHQHFALPRELNQLGRPMGCKPTSAFDVGGQGLGAFSLTTVPAGTPTESADPAVRSASAASVTHRAGYEYEARIFDFDGTLIDTGTLNLHAVHAALAVCGAPVPLVWLRTVAFGDLGVLRRRFHEDFGESLACSDQEIVLAGRAYWLDHAEQARPVETVAAAARAAAAAGPVAVASANDGQIVRAGLAATGLSDLFSVVIARRDVTRLKPAPDAYLMAAERLGVRPSQCLAYENSDEGVTAARAAHMNVIDVRNWDGSH